MTHTHTHDPTTCPKCHREQVPVYELALPASRPIGMGMGALHLSAHNCPNGGDHIQLQPEISLAAKGATE